MPSDPVQSIPQGYPVFRSAGPKTVDPPADRLLSLTTGTLTIPAGALARFDSLGGWPIFVNGLEIGTLRGAATVLTGETTKRIRFFLTPVSFGDVQISTEPASDAIPVTNGTVEIPIRLRVTRANLVFGQDLITIEAPRTPQFVYVDVPLAVPAGTTIESGFIGEWISVGPGPAGGIITLYPDDYSHVRRFVGAFRSDAVATRSIVVVIRPAPAPLDFRAEPPELTYRYSIGQPTRPIESLMLTAFGGHKTIQPVGLHPDWFDVLAIPSASVNPGAPVSFPMEANLSNRPPGFYETEFELRVDNTRQPIRALFEIYDQPGSLSIQTSGGGRVESSPARNVYSNGDRIFLTAIPDRYFRFAGWSGTINSSSNPLEVRINGPMTIRAQFVFSGDNSCGPSISPARIEAPPEGDVGRLEVTTTPSCNWSVSDIPTWLRITGQHQGPGAATTLSYSVDPIPTTAGRSASLRIGATTVPVRQSGSTCRNVRPFPSPPEFSREGFAEVTITESGEACPDDLGYASSWVRAVPGSPRGFFREANPNSFARSTFLYLGGYRLPVIQRGLQAPTPYDDTRFDMESTPAIGLLKHHNIVEPCAANRFCPDANLTRAAIAPWIVRAVLGTDAFPGSQTPLFSDVAASHPQFRYVQKLAELGITTGCGNGRYCPDRLITRGELAVFLIRAGARLGPGAVIPHPAKPYFRDVPDGAPFFAYIQKLRQWGATSGCSATEFCPSGSVTREQAATLLVRTLLTPTP